jgi:hypothetical protein
MDANVSVVRPRRLVTAAFALVLALEANAGAADHLDAARYFDQLGVRAYAEGRYADAVVYFRQAFENGGPPTELWNMAKCELSSGQPREAVALLETYLARGDLTAEDRAEAEKLLTEIRKRPSLVSVASSPSGATVRIDDHVVGTTPLTTTVAPGEHDLYVETSDGRSFDRTITAENGVTIAVGTDLGEPSGNPRQRPPPPPRRPIKRVGIEIFPLGVSFALRGDAPLSPYVSPSIGLTYTLVAGRRALFGVGARFAVAFERWTASAGVSNVAPGCELPVDYSAAELLAHPFLFGAVRLGTAVDVGARAGFGLAGLASPSALGGDYFEPGCDVRTGLRGDFFAALDVSIKMGALRLLVQPVTLDLHSGYGGARTTPFDTTGLWARVGLNLGVAVDL